MPISQGDMLFGLIQSLTKAEKRSFKLYIRRLQKEGGVKFFRLFEVLEKWEVYDESLLREQLKIRTVHQLSNLKRNLYLHILTSLRLIRINQDLDIQIRELINYAQILYGRGLYLQSLRLLDKAKSKARSHHQDLLHLEIIEFEKRIESRHITRSTNERMTGLMEESSERSLVHGKIVEWSNLKLRLQRWFINNGHVKDETTRDKIAYEYSFCFSDVDIEKMTFFEKVHYYQAHYWLHYLLLDMVGCRAIANEWVVLYRMSPKVINEDVDSYLHALHSLLTTAYYLSDFPTFSITQDQLEHFILGNQKSFNENSQVLAFLYMHLATLNNCLIEGDLKRALHELPKIEKEIGSLKKLLDPHKVHLFYYKFAWIYLSNGLPEQAIDYLQQIINDNDNLRDDIVIYSQFQLFMAHYDLNNMDILEYLLSSAVRMVRKSNNKNTFQKSCIKHFRKMSTAGAFDREEKFKDFRMELKQSQADPFLRRDFLYLDVPLWIDSQLAKKNMADISIEVIW